MGFLSLFDLDDFGVDIFNGAMVALAVIAFLLAIMIATALQNQRDIEFTVHKHPLPEMAEQLGCGGFIFTSETLTDEQLERLRIFWLSNGKAFEDRDRFLLPVSE